MGKKISSPKLWKVHEKIGFRFALIFFILFIVFMDWAVNPILSYLYYYGGLAAMLDGVVSWAGKDLFQIPYTIISPYDGEHNDRTYTYLLYFIIALVSIVGTIIWTIFDRKRNHYQSLYYGLTTIIRYYLAFTMFLFALYKFFKLQFPDHGYYTLTSKVGDMSPMHLAWAFFGHSFEYNVFMGLAECAGLFLLFRRTTTFGAILTMVALMNITVVNYSFDVHAKMYPTTLFLMALFLVLRDVKKIFQFFFTRHPISLSTIKAPIFQKKWIQMSKTILKVLVIGYFLIASVKDVILYKMKEDEKQRAKSELAGVYKIQSFVIDQDTLPEGHELRWRQLIVDDGMLEAIRLRGDSIAFASISVAEEELITYGDPINRLMNRQEVYNEFGNSDDTYFKMDSILIARQLVSRFYFELVDSATLRLKGIIKNDSVAITAKKQHLDINDFRLLKRRPQWVNEAVYFY